MGSSGYNVYNVIIDHCSFSWGADETLDVSTWYGDTYDITISNCLIAQGLDDATEETHHALGVLLDAKNKATRNLTISMHHNYMAHFRYRYPEVGVDVQFRLRNNVIYNWENATNTNIDNEPGSTSTTNLIHNFYKQGALAGNTCGVDCSEGFMCDYEGGGKCTANDDNAYKIVYIEGNLGCTRTLQTDPDGVDAHLRTGWSPGAWLSSAWINEIHFPLMVSL